MPLLCLCGLQPQEFESKLQHFNGQTVIARTQGQQGLKGSGKSRASGCKILASQTRNAACSRLSTGQFATGPKRSMGHVLGGEKGFFLIRGSSAAKGEGSRACGILSIPAQEVSLGSPRVSSIHVQSPTPPLPARYTSAKMHLKPDVSSIKCQSFRSRALWRSPSTGACGLSDYPTPDLSQRGSESRSAPEKSV